MSEFPVTSSGRRRFLRVLALAAAGGAMTACATRVTTGAGAAPVTLDDFLALSALLTGVKDLNAEHGRLYLASLTRAEARQLAAVTARSGLRGAAPPATLEALVRTGALDTAAARRVTATIVECWYTGVYASPSGPRVATYLEALAWSTLGFTKPPTVCGGGMGYWAEAPPSGA
jgi:Membrane bound FAD containing D-sorbitol dehydrogenase